MAGTVEGDWQRVSARSVSTPGYPKPTPDAWEKAGRAVALRKQHGPAMEAFAWRAAAHTEAVLAGAPEATVAERWAAVVDAWERLRATRVALGFAVPAAEGSVDLSI